MTDSQRSTIFPTEAPVEAVNAYLPDAGLTGAVVEGALHLRLCGALLNTDLLQPVLVMQEFIHQLLDLKTPPESV